VDFRNTTIILTSNLGSDILSSQPEGHDSQEVRELVMEVVRRHFRPEFLNRLDEVLLFHHLTRSHMGEIVKIQLKNLEVNLKQQNLSLDYDDKVLDWLANKGFDPIYGARPLKRTIQRELQNNIAKLLLAGDVANGGQITLKVDGGGIVIKNQ